MIFGCGFKTKLWICKKISNFYPNISLPPAMGANCTNFADKKSGVFRAFLIALPKKCHF
jgi:hypothetical protein